MGASTATPLTSRAIKGMYFAAHEAAQADSWVQNIANVYDTDQPQEEYPWLGANPTMRKWEGERTAQELRGDKVILINEDYESTIEFRGQDFRRDKTTQIQARIREQAENVVSLPERLISALLVANGTAYDNVAFFHASSHVVGSSGVIKNALGTGDGMAGAAAPTSAQQATNILLAIQKMLGFLNDQGEPLNALARMFKVMVPVNMWSATIAALQDEFTSAGVSNTMASLRKRGVSIDVVCNPRLTTTNRFFVFREDGPIKPFIYQSEMDEPGMLDESSEHFFKTKRVQFGVSASAAAGYGRFEYAIQCTTS